MKNINGSISYFLTNLEENLTSVDTNWPLTEEEIVLKSAYQMNLKTFLNQINEFKSNGVTNSEYEIHELLMNNYLYPLVIQSVFYLITNFNGKTLSLQTEEYCIKYFSNFQLVNKEDIK